MNLKDFFRLLVKSKLELQTDINFLQLDKDSLIGRIRGYKQQITWLQRKIERQRRVINNQRKELNFSRLTNFSDAIKQFDIAFEKLKEACNSKESNET